MLTKVNPKMLAQTVEAVFLDMMKINVLPSKTPWVPSHHQLTSVVHISGDWNGALLLECDRQLACQFAGRFLSMDAPENVNDEVRDVLGELAKMIGGNMKSALGEGLSLSMPSVTDGSDYGLRVCGSKIQGKLAFECADGPFWVTLLAVAPGTFTGCKPLS